LVQDPRQPLIGSNRLFDEILEARPVPAIPLWGVGVGLPGPVEFSRGRPMAPPIMSGWDAYPVRDRLAARYDVPAWVDNDVNILALGELRAGIGVGEQDLLYVKVGTGIGAGLISGGRLHRGAQGAAGDIGHVPVLDDDSVLCRCGNTVPAAWKPSPVASPSRAMVGWPQSPGAASCWPMFLGPPAPSLLRTSHGPLPVATRRAWPC
jgi:ROK family